MKLARISVRTFNALVLEVMGECFLEVKKTEI
jgi:hypothetical protein